MENFNFLGRRDGIGNRLEEIIKLYAYACEKKIKCNYIWKNQHKHRSFKIMLGVAGDEINITTTPQPGVPFIKKSDINLTLNRNEALKYASKIIPNFKIAFTDNIKPLGVHIRSTDRIRKSENPNFMKNKREFFSFLWNTITLVNNRRPSHLFVCSDDKEMLAFFISNLDKKIKIVKPVCEKNIDPAYVDFFSLTQCEEIIMCSKFSSFLALASLIGDVPIIVFYLHENSKNRFKMKCQYAEKIHFSDVFLLKEFYRFRIRNFFLGGSFNQEIRNT